MNHKSLRSAISGSWVAIVTPFDEGGVDTETLRGLVRFQIENSTSGICPCGTTGEAATLSFDERAEVIRTVVDEVAGRIPVFAGTGTNNTAETVALSKQAMELGSDGLLVVTPYYNRPQAKGLDRHYREIAAQTGAPIILYNVPSRTGCNLLPETIIGLADVEEIVAVKEASGSLDQATKIAAGCDLALLSGDDGLTLPLIAVGASGVISVLANALPGPMAELVRLGLEGNLAASRALHHRLHPLMSAIFVETNPVPIKAALGMLGRCNETVRAPLFALSSDGRAVLRSALTQFGLDKV